MNYRAVLCCAWAAAILGLLPTSGHAEVSPRLYAVEASAQVQKSPAQIKLEWPADPSATGYTVHRKTLAASSWTQIASLPATATGHTDSNVGVGNAYEYQILKTTSRGYTGTGYVYAGIEAQMIENRGKLVLVVDNTHAAALALELARLQSDLVGDGWTVVRHDVSRTASVPSVKALIKGTYDADPANTKAVFLFGHVPVPYSGNYAPDGHPDHVGAWAADAYYADMNGTWTDSTVNNSSAQKLWNRNTPGDGKFDQSDIPSDLELQVGRVDLYNMTCFANKVPSRSEVDLLRQYLNKDHKFRHGQLPLPRRGLVCDNFGESGGEAFASSGWRNFAPAFGANNNVQVPAWTFFSTLNSQGYLWAYGTGGGSWYTCNGVGGSDDFATHDIKAVFTMFLGSYFGDWDNESNFLRAPLGSSSYTLATAWAGRPHWYFHHMALGEHIGLSAKLSQNNRQGGVYRASQNWGTRQVHAALLGDPSLRLHPVIPPSEVTAAVVNGMTLSWKASTDTAIQGYVVYRANSAAGPFSRVSGSTFVSGTSFVDPAGTSQHAYMVRAVKLEQSASGTYFNPSQGVYSVAGQVVTPEPTPEPTPVPAAPSNLKATAPFPNQVHLAWTDQSNNEKGFTVYRRIGATGPFLRVALVPANVSERVILLPTAGETHSFKVCADNDEGSSLFSNIATVTTPAAVPGGEGGAIVYRIRSSPQGAWSACYGAEGYSIIGDSASLPSYVSITPSEHKLWTWNPNPSDFAALVRESGTSRIAAAWYADESFNVTFSFKDNEYHRTALYFMDWEKTGREQVVEIYDANSGRLYSSRTFKDFGDGIYIWYELKGAVVIKIRALKGTPVLSGIFFGGPADTQAHPVTFSPSSTLVPGETVSMSCLTLGSVIHYTIDGSTPTQSSPRYFSPITVPKSGTLKARGFKDGLQAGPVASATIGAVANSNSAKVRLLGVNSTRGGSWKGSIGLDGQWIPGDSQNIPSYASVAITGKSDWVWQYNTTEMRALQKRTLNSRIASCSYAANAFDISIDLKDGKTHQVSLYALDWDRAGRSQKIEIFDFATKQLLHTQSLSSFGNGVWLDYAVEGHVLIRVTRTGPVNAVLSGIFWDASALDL